MSKPFSTATVVNAVLAGFTAEVNTLKEEGGYQHVFTLNYNLYDRMDGQQIHLGLRSCKHYVSIETKDGSNAIKNVLRDNFVSWVQADKGLLSGETDP
jgi:hypothetical protein